MTEEIIRTLENGPDYAPAWRHQVVQGYLADVLAAPDSRARLIAILDAERDPFVRQYLRFRFDGNAANAEGFRYAVGCQTRNAETGAASIIRAMILADRTPDEIAVELGTKPFNIVTFGKVFFDVRRYLDNESFLSRIVFAEQPKDMTERESLREKRWLAAAFHRGWAGVEQVVFHRPAATAASIEELTMRLQSTLASRALEFTLDLETSGTVPTEADLSRFLAARNTQARQQEPPSDQNALMLTFIRGLHGDLAEKAAQNPDDPTLEPFRQLLAAGSSTPVSAPKRLRTRFAGT